MESRFIQQGIKLGSKEFNEKPLIQYDYQFKEILQKTTYIIKHTLDWVQEYFIEQESNHRNFQIISEGNFGQKNLFKADSAEPDQILLPRNDQQIKKIQLSQIEYKKEYKKEYKNSIKELQSDHSNKDEKEKQIVIDLPCQNEGWKFKEYTTHYQLRQDDTQLRQDDTYVIKNLASQSVSLFYKSSLTVFIQIVKRLEEYQILQSSFTIYKYFFQHGTIPTQQQLNNLYLPYQSLQLIRDYVLKGNPYIINLDKQNPSTYFEIKNDLLSVNNVYKFEGDCQIRIQYIGNLRDYCKKDTLYINFALEQVINNHIIYESQLDYIQEILLNKMESKVFIFYQKILDLLLLPIVVIELQRLKQVNLEKQYYLLFGYKDRIYYLGNRQQNEIYIESDSISNYQCSIEFLNGVWQIFDGFKNKFNERRPSIFGTWKLLYDEVEIKNSGQFKIKENIFRLQIS